ncbi:hypothetical protein HDU82_004600 [Entophlyctis luteolus]|nr:hypothetical protein HDU82_004600 [Entophlyctis luteolus]
MDLRPLQAKSPPPHQPASTPPSYGSSTTRQRSLKAPLTILVADSGAKVAIPSTLAAAHADSASRSAAAQWTHAVAREINVDADSLILLDARTGKVVTTPPTAFGEDSPRQSLTLVAFDRRLLEPEHTSLSILEGVGPGETWMQPPVSMNVLVPLVIPSNAPMNVVLDSCFSTFKSNVEYARAVIDSSNRNLQTMERLFEEQKIQAQALRTALLSLQTHVKPICDAFDIFMAHSQKEIAKHAALIQNFPSDLQALHRIPMHNKITKSTETKFLSDYVPEGKLLAWVDKCRAVHDEFVKKNVALSETFKNLRNGTDAEASHALDVE